jgi:hypothetical protein
VSGEHGWARGGTYRLEGVVDLLGRVGGHAGRAVMGQKGGIMDDSCMAGGYMR